MTMKESIEDIITVGASIAGLYILQAMSISGGFVWI